MFRLIYLLRIFGVVATESEDDSLNLMKTVSSYRDDIRKMALEKRDFNEFLKRSDVFRDSVNEFGFVFEDRPDGNALVRAIEKEVLARQKADQEAKEAEKQMRKLELEQKANEKLEKAKIPPSEMLNCFVIFVY